MSKRPRAVPLAGPVRQAWNISHIAAEDIEVGERLRSLDEVWARDLGHRMLSDGQDTPIEVVRIGDKFRLVVGAHRLDAAYQYRGLSPIEALILDSDIAECRIAMLIADHHEGGARPIAALSLVADIHALLGVVKSDAEPLGSDERIARIAAQLGLKCEDIAQMLDTHGRIRARVVAMLQDHPIGALQLEALARLDPAEQEKVAYLLLGGIESVAEAVGQLPARRFDSVPSPRIDAFVAHFEQMSLAEKEAALARLRPLAPPSIGIRWTGP